MSNELRDIANRLTNYDNTEGWVITSAMRKEDGSWDLVLKPLITKEDVDGNSAES